MAFFDDLSKKISQVSQSAVQKTKDLGDITKLNVAIADEEKKLNNLYIEIGKKYVETHSQDSEEAFSAMVHSCKVITDQIKSYKEQIKEIKGYVKCEKCGSDVLNTNSFCSECGHPIPKPVVEEKFVKCEACGNMVDKTMRFCTNCGHPMAAQNEQNAQ